MTRDIGRYTPETARWVVDQIKWLKSRGYIMPGEVAPAGASYDQRAIHFRNLDEQEVPAYGCMQVIGVQNPNGSERDRSYLLVQRPQDQVGENGWYIVNGHEPVPPTKYGVGYDGPHVRVLAPTSTAGQRFAPTVNDWVLTASGNGVFIAAGEEVLPQAELERKPQRMFLGSPTSGGGPVQAGRIIFRTNTRMVDQKVEVTIIEILGVAYNLMTGEPYQVGDTLTVHDIRNAWPNAEQDATGIAFPIQERMDDPETNEDESRDPYWQIEQCTLPIDLVEGYIESCVFKESGNTVNVHFHCDDQLNPVVDMDADAWMLSSESAIDVPPEWNQAAPGSGAYKYTVQAENPDKLDGPAVLTGQSGSRHNKCRIRRVVKKGHSTPYNESLETPSEYEYEVTWVLEWIEDQMARFCRGTISGTNAAAANPTEFWDGATPMQCSPAPAFEWACDKQCGNGEEACFVASYSPEQNKYYIISTDFALLGKPKLVELDPNLRIETDPLGNKSLCVDKFQFLACDIEDVGDSCVDLYECPD